MSTFLNEVMQQPDALERLISHKGELEKRFSKFSSARKILFMGMGASFYASSYISHILIDSGIYARAERLSDFLGYKEAWRFLENFDLIVLISQSGETIELLRALEKEEIRKKSILVSNNPHSSAANILGRDKRFEIYAGEEKAMGSSKTFLNTLVTLLIMYESLTGVKIEYKEMIELTKILLDVDISAFERFIESSTFPIFVGWKHGKNLLDMVKLTFIEVAKKPSLVYEGGMFRHGAMEILARSTNVVLLPCKVKLKNYESLKNDLLSIGFNPFIVDEKSFGIEAFEMSYQIRPIPFMVIFQRVAETLSRCSGFNPGKGIFSTKVTKKE